MPMLEGPTFEVGLELPHQAGLVVTSSCRVVMGIVVVGSVVVVRTHLNLSLCSCFSYSRHLDFN